MTDEEYIRHELSKAASVNLDHTVRIKMRSERGESRWVNLPPLLTDPVVAVASASPDELSALLYLLSCIAEDPRYLSSPDTQHNLENLYARMMGRDTEREN